MAFCKFGILSASIFCAGVLATVHAQASREVGFYFSEYSEVAADFPATVSSAIRQEFVEHSRVEAREILSLASNSPRASVAAKEIYQRVQETLRVTVIRAPSPGHEFAYCPTAGAAARYRMATGEIYVCDSTLREMEDAVPQILIHEAAHASGYNPRHMSLNEAECKATEVELSAMNQAGRTPIASGLVAECGLSRDYEIE